MNTFDANQEENAIRELPELAKLPKRERDCMALKAYGMSNVAVAAYLGCDEKTVRNIIERHDPERRLILSETAKKQFLAHNLLSLINESISTITPAEIRELKPEARLRFAQTASSVLANLKTSSPDKPAAGVSDLLKSLEA